MIVPIFQGLESAGHRETLDAALELFVPDTPPSFAVSLSYKSLKTRRLGMPYVEKLSEKYPVILEAGVSNTPLSNAEALDLRDEYYRFALETESLYYIIEFDHTALDESDRTFPANERIVPVLFDPEDPNRLDHILSTWGQVAMAYQGDKRIPAILRSKNKTGIAIALASPDLELARNSGFNAAMSNAWLTPGKFGELILWDGSKFHRAKGEYRTRLLEKYSHVIERIGLDMELVARGDSRELTRLAAYTYLAWSQSLMRGVSDNEEASVEAETETSESASAIVVSKSAKKIRPTMPLPVFTTEKMDALETAADGTSGIRRRHVLHASSETVRVCDTCFLSSTCPAFEPEASCAFNFPIEVRTDAQVRALLHSMVELQATRVAFARFAEEVNGGMPDPAVGIEMDRLVRIADRVKRSEERKERLTVSVEAETMNGGVPGTAAAGGVLSRIFGDRASVPAPVADAIIQGELSDTPTPG